MLGRKKIGVMSEQLLELYKSNIKEYIPFTIRSGTFPNITKDDSVILIATGTGIAPIRSFLQHRFHKTSPSGQTILFFGCRNKNQDYLYGNEIESYKGMEYYIAFSRHQDEKVYVQHLVKYNPKLVNDLLLNSAFIILVGNSKVLPKSIDKSLKYALEQEGGFDKDTAEDYISEMKLTGRYYIETW
jgi:sulfite reductase alpha subunit-like flavoprotein